MVSKKCTACHQNLPLESFVVCKRNKDGRGAKCKECHKVICTNYVSNNKMKRLNSSREYWIKNKPAHRARVRAWQDEHPENMVEIKNRYKASHPERDKTYRKKFGSINTKKYRAAYPEKYKARNKVNNAVANAIIPKLENQLCMHCGKQAKEYHHHKGYAPQHWLDVIPLCKPCHIKAG